MVAKATILFIPIVASALKPASPDRESSLAIRSEGSFGEEVTSGKQACVAEIRTRNYPRMASAIEGGKSGPRTPPSLRVCSSGSLAAPLVGVRLITRGSGALCRRRAIEKDLFDALAPVELLVPISSVRRRGRVAVREGTRFAIWARAARAAGALRDDRIVQESRRVA